MRRLTDEEREYRETLRLTEEEKKATRAATGVDREHHKTGMDKLKKLQALLTDPDHINKINDIIPTAEFFAKMAEEAAKKEGLNGQVAFSKTFHRSMNQLTKEKGMRC